MKKAIRISISLLLSAFILLGGSGLIIGKMVCLKSGHTIFAAKEMKDCCDEPEADFSFQDQCCDINNISFYQENFIPQSHTLLKSPPVLFSSISFADLISFLSEKAHSPARTFEADVPPDYQGAPPLVFLSTFRI